MPDLDRALQMVRDKLARDVPFEHIEAFIDTTVLDSQQRAVLWLYAWCGGQAQELREIVNATK